MKKKIIFLMCFLFMIFGSFSSIWAAENFDSVNLIENTSRDNITRIQYAGHEWYVIKDESDHIYLLSTDKFFGEKYNLSTSTNGHPNSGIHYSSDGSTNYQGSLVQSKLEEILSLDFSNQEINAIDRRDLDGVTDADSPQNQSLWIMSKDEYDAINTDLRITENPDHYWLRSARNNFVWFVDAAGNAYANFTLPQNGYFGIRPAFYLDKSKIAFYSDSSTGKPGNIDTQLKAYTVPTSNNYKINLIDSSMNLEINNLVVFNGEMKFDYSTDNIGEDNYLYVRYKNGNDTYEGVVAHLENKKGEATVTVPGNVDASATVEFYNIKYNDANLTNYVSEPVVAQNLNEKWVFSDKNVTVSGISPYNKVPEINIIQTSEDAQENSIFNLKENEKYIISYNIESSKEYEIVEGSQIDVSFDLGLNYKNKVFTVYQENNGNVIEYSNISADENGIVSLKVDNVSQFLLAEVTKNDDVIIDDDSNIGNIDENINTPDTSDDSNINVYLAIIMISGIGCMISYYILNKKRHN